MRLQIETFENGVSEEDRRYADPKQQDHGYNGGLAISAPPLENDIRLSLQAGLDLGVSWWHICETRLT